MYNHHVRDFAVQELESIRELLNRFEGFEEASVLIKWAIEKAILVECSEEPANTVGIASQYKTTQHERV